jgi:hypothetical protein
MQKPTDDPTQYAAGKPLQVGVSNEQSAQIREEIAHSGVANGEKDIEQNATPGRETGGDDSPTTPSTVIVGNVTAD